MAYFNVCDNCGAHLDPGEVCDCMKKPAEGTNQGGRVVDLKDSQQLIATYYYYTTSAPKSQEGVMKIKIKITYEDENELLRVLQTPLMYFIYKGAKFKKKDKNGPYNHAYIAITKRGNSGNSGQGS